MDDFAARGHMLNHRKSLLAVIRTQQHNHTVLPQHGVVVVSFRVVQPLLGVSGKIEILQTDVGVALLVAVEIRETAAAVVKVGKNHIMHGDGKPENHQKQKVDQGRDQPFFVKTFDVARDVVVEIKLL